MNRRQFFQAMGAVAAAAVVNPNALLPTPTAAAGGVIGGPAHVIVHGGESLIPGGWLEEQRYRANIAEYRFVKNDGSGDRLVTRR